MSAHPHSNAPAQTSAAPSRRRLLAPDMSRGAMLLLIAAAYATVYAGSSFGADVSQLPLVDRVTTFASAVLLDNRAFPLFAILFGYWTARGVLSRQHAGATPGGTYLRLVRRSGALLLFGALHAILVFPGEILSAYGIALLLVGWVLLLSTKVIVVVLGVLLAGSALVNTLIAIVAAYGAGTDPQTYEAIPGYLTADDWVQRLASYPVSLVFTALGYPLLLLVMIGFLAGRVQLFEDLDRHGRTLRMIAVVGIAVSVGAAVPAAAVSVGVIDPGWAVAGLLNGVQIFTGVAGGLGYASLFTLVGARLEQRAGPISRALAAMGSRSLTFYIVHSVLLAVILHPQLLGVGVTVGPFGAVMVSLGVWLSGLVAASLLERAGRPGPLDAFMKRLVDGPKRA